MSTRTGMGFRCGGALGRGAWARVASSGCLRWPAERDMGVDVGRPEFGVKLSSLAVLKATLSLERAALAAVSTRTGMRGPPAVSVGLQLSTLAG